MSKYNAGHAAHARHQFLLDQGHEDITIDAWPQDGWLDDGPDRFVYYDRSGSHIGKVACKVEFLDDDGGAEVTFADRDGGVVNIGEDDDPEEIEDEEDPDDDDEDDEDEEDEEDEDI